MSINANVLKIISTHIRDKANMSIIDNMLDSCLERATFGKREYTNDIHPHRVNDDDMQFIVNHFNLLNFDVSFRFIKEDGYYEITLRW